MLFRKTDQNLVSGNLKLAGFDHRSGVQFSYLCLWVAIPATLQPSQREVNPKPLCLFSRGEIAHLYAPLGSAHLLCIIENLKVDISLGSYTALYWSLPWPTLHLQSHSTLV